jgi:hypothetical protein
MRVVVFNLICLMRRRSTGAPSYKILDNPLCAKGQMVND